MRLPRDLSGADLVKQLERLGYHVTRQSGSHLRLTSTAHGKHHVTLPRHDLLRIGTLAAVLDAAAVHHRLDRDALLDRLFN